MKSHEHWEDCIRCGKHVAMNGKQCRCDVCEAITKEAKVFVYNRTRQIKQKLKKENMTEKDIMKIAQWRAEISFYDDIISGKERLDGEDEKRKEIYG